MTVEMRRALALAVAGLVTVSVAALSRVPYVAHRGEDAQLRLAWRARSARVDECRRLTPAEIQRLPVHMRRTEVCEGRILPYRLEVELDGVSAADDTIRPSGARSDRPLYVFREFALAPGGHQVRIAFTREAPARAQAQRSATPPPGAGVSTETPPRLELETEVALAPREVALVTYDEERGALIVVRRGSRRKA